MRSGSEEAYELMWELQAKEVGGNRGTEIMSYALAGKRAGQTFCNPPGRIAFAVRSSGGSRTGLECIAYTGRDGL